MTEFNIDRIRRAIAKAMPYYVPFSPQQTLSSPFMCIALIRATDCGAITPDEKEEATTWIQTEIYPFVALKSWLEDRGRPYSTADRVALYERFIETGVFDIRGEGDQ